MTTKITEKNISNLANAGVQWQSVVVADGSTGLTAVAGRGYFINTTSGVQTVTLPASSNVGDVIVLKDYARTWGTNAVSIASNTFDGVAGQTPSFSTNGQTVTLVYMDNTKGWSLVNEDTTTSLGATFITATGGTVLTSGDFKTHVFTGDGCFVVSTLGNPAGGGSGVDYLVVAGGGGGASGSYSGGGGSGGLRTTFPSPTSCSTGPFPITAQTYPITVGAGGAGTSGPPNANGTAGSISTFSTITSAGGGQSNAAPGLPNYNGSAGGSGGGGRSEPGSPQGGAGNTPPVSPPQGNSGGTGGAPSSGYGGGGGGGSGASGTTGASPAPATAGSGGIGSTISTDFFGPTAPSYGTPGPAPGRYFAGGGGGANDANRPYSITTNEGAGGAGGGGRSGQPNYPAQSGPDKNRTSAAGTINTGGGGGGGSSSCAAPGAYNGSAGGTGIVVIRYKFQ